MEYQVAKLFNISTCNYRKNRLNRITHWLMMKMRINFEDLKMSGFMIATARILVSIFAVSRFLTSTLGRGSGNVKVSSYRIASAKLLVHVPSFHHPRRREYKNLRLPQYPRMMTFDFLIRSAVSILESCHGSRCYIGTSAGRYTFGWRCLDHS